MFKYKIYLAFFASVSFLACAVLAEDSGLKLTVLVTQARDVGSLGKPLISIGEGRFRYDVVVGIRNDGGANLIVAKGDSDLIAHESAFNSTGEIVHSIVYRCEIVKDSRGVVIPSVSDLKLVELRRGEVTYLRLAFFCDEQIPSARFKFVYHLGPLLSARFGTWSGKIEQSPL